VSGGARKRGRERKRRKGQKNRQLQRREGERWGLSTHDVPDYLVGGTGGQLRNAMERQDSEHERLLCPLPGNCDVNEPHAVLQACHSRVDALGTREGREGC
jgi:hypothetical protein